MVPNKFVYHHKKTCVPHPHGDAHEPNVCSRPPSRRSPLPRRPPALAPVPRRTLRQSPTTSPTLPTGAAAPEGLSAWTGPGGDDGDGPIPAEGVTLSHPGDLPGGEVPLSPRLRRASHRWKLDFKFCFYFPGGTSCHSIFAVPFSSTCLYWCCPTVFAPVLVIVQIIHENDCRNVTIQSEPFGKTARKLREAARYCGKNDVGVQET